MDIRTELQSNSKATLKADLNLKGIKAEEKEIIKKSIDRIYESNCKRWRRNPSDRCFSNILLHCDDPESVNVAVKKYLEEMGFNIVEVTADGFEIRNEQSCIQDGLVCKTGVIFPEAKTTDELKKPKTVLFLPSLDKMTDLWYRRMLLDMAREHCVVDPRNGEHGFTNLDGSFFAVATIGGNPYGDYYELVNVDAKGSFMYSLDIRKEDK